MNKGTVKWFSSEKGFGFIAPDDGGKDLFVHHSQINSADSCAIFNDGQKVKYDLYQGKMGPCVNNVTPI